MARTSAPVSVTGANVVDVDAFGSILTRCVWIGAAVDLERHVDAVDRLAAVVGDAGGDGDALLIRERRALERDRRDREVRRLRVADQ